MRRLTGLESVESRVPGNRAARRAVYLARDPLPQATINNQQSSLINVPAFTLIELLVIIAIIAVLMAILMPTFSFIDGHAERKKWDDKRTIIYCNSRTEAAAKGFGKGQRFNPPNVDLDWLDQHYPVKTHIAGGG